MPIVITQVAPAESEAIYKGVLITTLMKNSHKNPGAPVLQNRVPGP